MAKKSKAARARAKAIDRIQQGLPAGQLPEPGRRGSADRNLYRELMEQAYVEVFAWQDDNPDLADRCFDLTEDEVGDLVYDIAYGHPPIPMTDDIRLKAAWMLRTWAILHETVWMYDWPVPIAAMSDAEIVAAIMKDKDAGLIPDSLN